MSQFRHDQVFSSHYDITTYLIKMDVFARNAVDSSAQLLDPAAAPGLSNSSALAAALPGGHSRKETRNMVEWIYETDHYRKAGSVK